MANTQDPGAAVAADFSPASIGWVPWLRVRLFGPSVLAPRHASAAQLSSEGEVAHSAVQDGTTDTIIFQLALLGVAMLVFLCGKAVAHESWVPALTFIVWGAAGAFCAYVFGLLLGLLFGLPSTRGWSARNVVRQNDPSGRRSSAVAVISSEGQGGAPLGGVPSTTGLDDQWKDPDIPYDENTSLEQIADWLTKIIVGIGLTQFNSGRLYFNDLASELTAQMTGSERWNPVPGGLILVGFGALGFLSAYLWMRRYFISEMVIARRSALRVANALGLERANEIRLRAAQVANAVLKEQVEGKSQVLSERLKDYKARGSVQERSQPAALQPSDQQMEDLWARTSGPIASLLREIMDTELVDPEDCWKQRFGGKAEVDGFVLTGSVRAFEGDPSRFIIDLEVQAAPDKLATISSLRYVLHPSFDPMTVGVDFSTRGVAPLMIVAYQASTVGVVLDDGETMLELSLASLPTAHRYPVFLARSA